jgi:diguanylate cyclase (GGDEF)-like protein/PAS domain S-box-containing protein
MMAHDSHARTSELQALLDASPDAVLIVDQAGRIVALNRRVETLFATTAERLTGRSVETLLPERARQAHASARAAYSASAAVRAMSARSGLTGLRADGTEFPVEVSLTPIVGSTPGLVMAVVHDVASRIPVERMIASQDQAVGALDAIPDAILTTDADGNIAFLNRSAEELTGRTRDSAFGRPLSEVLPVVSEASGEPLANPLAGCLGAPGGSCEAVLPARPGHDSRALDLSTTPIRGSSGAVTGAAVVARDVTHARLIARELVHQATHDALTGLVNRGEFERRLTRALASAAEEHGEHVVCFLDLDGFKRVNDACGHLAGDELLRQLSDVMRERMRSRDTLARLGGDEFGMLLEHCRLPRAERIAEEIRKGIGAHRFTVGAETYAVAASIGIVPIRPGIRRLSDVMEAADAACYLAKRSGGNRIQVSAPQRQGAGVAGKGEASRRVVHAIEENRFRLYAQPMKPLDPGDLGSPRFELLLRLDEGRGELLSPHAFLPAARRQGLMPAVDRWVVREAVQRLSDWQRVHPGREHVTVAINLDDETVTTGEVLTLVRGELARTGVRPHVLCFEVSESVVVAHPAASASLLHDLRAAGCQTTLEHCGSGMAAFTLLRRLQPDYLKIAGHIVRGLARDPVHRALATALNKVGHVLGLKTIGIQVEGPAALECLRRIGVDYGQGFGIGRPEPLEDAVARLDPAGASEPEPGSAPKL